MFCYVMIEYYLQGCRAAITVKQVSLDQQFAYNWSLQETEEFITREVKQVPFITP